MKIRRVVTDSDKEGKSFIKWDSEIEGSSKRKGLTGYSMWATRKLPVEFTDEDPNNWDIGAYIKGGSVFRLGLFEPGVEAKWHRTETIDYAVVVSGEIDLQLDKDGVHLKQGDVVVHRAGNHNWANRGTVPCLMLFAMIATE